MDLSRRGALRLGGGLGIGTLSGCSLLPSGSRRLTMNLLNFAPEPHRLRIQVLRWSGDDRSDSLVLQEMYDLEPPGEDEGAYALERPDVLESRKYLFRADLYDDRSVANDYVFYPDCSGDGEPPEEVYVEVHDRGDEPYIRFQQNVCG